MLVGLVMGSPNDWDYMQPAHSILSAAKVPTERMVVSAHRTPNLLFQYAENANGRLDAIIAGAGGAAHLPGMLASKTLVPVLGVPIPSAHLNGVDSLLSISQMPDGVPVATFGIGHTGAGNAALFVLRMLARRDERVMDFLRSRNVQMAEKVLKSKPWE